MSQVTKHTSTEKKRCQGEFSIVPFFNDLEEIMQGLEPRLFPDKYYDETKPIKESHNDKVKGKKKKA